MGARLTRTRRRCCSTLGVAVLAVAACTGVQTTTGVYATLSEARDAGAIDRGLVPGGLPSSTIDLREAHRGDEQLWGVFAFAPADGGALRALVGAEITADPPDCDPPGRLEWWPRLLRSPIDLGQVHATGLQIYRSRDGRLTYAVHWRQGRAFYWK